MKRAFIAIRPTVVPRMTAVSEGLTRLGYKLHIGGPGAGDYPSPADICVSWNRAGSAGALASMVVAAGGRSIVLENGYLGKGMTAVARDFHLGAGWWLPNDSPSRWAALGIALRPWRRQGRHILLCLSRGFGPPETAMPKDWPEKVQRTIAHWSGRPVRLRRHPAARDVGAVPPLAEDLVDCHAVVVWASNAGTEALVAGVPVFAGHPRWILEQAASGDISNIEDPALPDRLPAFIRLAWAQWSLDEIATGEPFARLLKGDAP